MLTVPWPVVPALLSGVGTVFLIAYLRRHRGKPGANWLLLALVGQALWCFSAGFALLVFEPSLRWGLEVLTWIGITWTGVPFFAFGLEYTGRGNVIRTPSFGLLVLLPVLTTVLVVTNPLHELVWQDFRLDPVFGAATVSYEFNAWAYAAIMIGTVFAASGTFLLFDTVVSYGPLYRSEALAVGISTLPPGIGLLVWLFGIGPVPQLNLSAALFLPHVLLDAYAFVGSGMFTFNPVTRRTADRSAIEDLENPFVVVNTDERVVDLNPAAAAWFDVSEPSVLGTALDVATGVDIDVTATNQVVTHGANGERRELAVSTSELRDPSTELVGHTIVFQDITEQRRRKQRLEILNRVLRHNLRNDLNVVDGYVGIAVERVDDEEVATMLERARTDVESVIGTGEKAWAFERAFDSTSPSPPPIALRNVLSAVADDLEGTTRGAVDVSVPADLVLAANREILAQLFLQLVENGLEHTDAEEPTVTVTGEAGDSGTAVVTVRDDGPGIPEHELAVLERGEETALEHGSGLGLWIVTWCVATLGGDVSFDASDGGTTVTVRLPGVVESNVDRSREMAASGGESAVADSETRSDIEPASGVGDRFGSTSRSG
ncbi:histidine kinase N-terminal 7TM domain-containing protein [Halosolutus amylolyticus]|uniref:histidine kinase n=1 Tax=Halosolutus amylolyticus TaxID=2932267 RepID=A0ABD5PVF3_9EURY|nr:histidine kinase N-terminal 7TM domain-containing protein [Halosolutus amylolyticus]